MSESVVNGNDKRPPTESGKSDASYAKTKRVRTKKRLDELQGEIDELENKQLSSGGEMMRLLHFFQKDSDRRAEADDRRRQA